MHDKITLNTGETLKHISSRSKGSMAETDIDYYEIINSEGKVVGHVTHTDHTSINGFHRSQSVIQKDIDGKIIVDKHW